MTGRLHRSEIDRKIGGVAGGLAEHFDWDPTLVRFGWLVIGVLSGGLAVVLYLVLWLVTPTYSRLHGATQPARISGAAVAARLRATSLGSTLVVGGILIAIGVVALLNTFGWFVPWQVWRLWPLLLIALGAALLLRR